MKIIFLVKYYDLYQIEVLKKIPNWEDLKYNELVEKINNDYFLMYNSFVNHFNKLGHEARLIIPNMKEIQEKWCFERNEKLPQNWMFEIPLKQIADFKPDILFLNSNFEYWGDFKKRASKYVKKICAWLSCPFPSSLSFENLDLVYTLFPPHFELFKSLRINAKLVHAGFDPEILPLLEKKKKFDVTFVGGIGSYHLKRTKFLMKLAKEVDINFWGYGFKSDNSIKNFLKQLKTGFRFKNNYQGLAWGLEMFNILYNSKITINVHGDIAKNHSVNMRMFEATGVGTMLFTEKSDSLQDFFNPEKEVISYSNANEAIEKIKYYLQNNQKREEIIKHGQLKTLNDFNYKFLIKNYEADFIKLLEN